MSLRLAVPRVERDSNVRVGLWKSGANAELNMDHSEAVKLQAVERYLLGELAAEQHDQFEEHYFSCPECAADINAAVRFVENARELLRTESPAAAAEGEKRRRPAWLMWFRPAYAMAAILLLLGVSAYQNLATIPQLRRQVAQASKPQALVSFSLVSSASRGPSPLTLRPPFGRAFGLYVDIPPGHFAEYVCEIRDGSDRPRFAMEVSAAEAKDTVQLLIPPSKLTPGRYALVVRGRRADAQGSEAEVARFPFALEFER